MLYGRRGMVAGTGSRVMLSDLCLIKRYSLQSGTLSKAVVDAFGGGGRDKRLP